MTVLNYTWLSSMPVTHAVAHRYDQRSDTMSEGGSLKLMRKIEAYWLKHGRNVHCTIINSYGPAKVTQGPHIFCVRSNMINGLPR